MVVEATFALKAAVWSRCVRFVIDLLNCDILAALRQEIYLSPCSNFPRPALSVRGAEE